MSHELEDEKGFFSNLDSKIFFNIRKFICLNNGSEEDAKEIFQEAFFQLAVRSKIKKLEINTSIEAYFFTVCKNLWRKELNRRKKWVRNDDIKELQEEEPEYDIIKDHQKWQLFKAKFTLLSENCQALLNDHFKKIPYDVIIKKYNYASSNVAFQRIFKCKKKLIELVRADDGYQKLRF